ncbi:MAG TPA: tetratricopeptide repeat protein [Acidobacteriaceae bacterium]|nr:tetratricopeptide repeat protein [Acidobacteriaceae bacterium]
MTLRFLASRHSSFRLVPLAAMLLAAPVVSAQDTAAKQPASHAATNSAEPAAATSDVDRSSAYYHYGLAHLYEEMAVSAGREDYATQAVEEYKLALNSDPKSAKLQDGLAELYFKIGHVKEAVTAAQEQVKQNPNDVEAYTLLGQVYLRSLGDMQGGQSAEMLRLAIAEYETIDRLKPANLETKLLLGQLYALHHDSAKAEAEFKDAQKIDADSEEVVLNMAQLYGQQGDSQRALNTLVAVPVDDRSARVEFEIGAYYDLLKKPKDAAAAYRRSLDLEPDNPDAERGLGNALLADDQMDEALKVFLPLVTADPTDAASEVHIAEILRRKGRYDEALATLEKAKLQPQAQDSPELNFNEAVIYDAQGKYDQATGVLQKMLDSSSHPDGKYTEAEKQNRAIFLSRLAQIYREQNKTAEAVATYKRIVDLGGDCAKAPAENQANPCYARDGYQGEVDAYRDAHQWKDATAVAAEAAKSSPKDRLVQMMYAQQLADQGQVEQALTLAKAQLGSSEDRDIEEDLTQMYIRLKRFPEATEYLEKAAPLATTPEQRLYVMFLRGEIYDRQKMHDQAEAQFREALKIDPQNAEILNYLGYMLADEGQKLPEALTMIAKAVELDPQNGAFLDSLGWAYYKSGQYAQAEENLRKANERMSTDPTVHDHLGELYEKTGKLKMAVAQWERSMTEYAHSLPPDADPEDVQKVQHKLEEARMKLAKLSPAPAEKATH